VTNINAIYRNASAYASWGYNQGIVWIKGNFNSTYSKLPTIDAVKLRALNVVATGKTHLWQHRVGVLQVSLVGAALAILYYVWRNSPQRPHVEMKTSLNLATLSIAVPAKKLRPPNVTLTLCIDLSGSMKEHGRGEAVQRALNTLLDHAQKVVDTQGGAKISIAITGFNDKASLITPVTLLVPQNPVSTVKTQVAALKFSGGTDILAGFEKATDELVSAAKANTQASHTLILLTDGDSNIDGDRLARIHSTLREAKAQFFAIGVGDHKKDVVEGLTKGKQFAGTYIDTTKGGGTIETAIDQIYKQAIGSFRELELTSSIPGVNTWSVRGIPGVADNGNWKVKLGALEEGKRLETAIQIHGERLTVPLDLSSVTFYLSFTDTQGRTGRISLPWDPNTIIEPAIVSAAKF
jgi:uncharacterized protein YegL